MKGEGEVISPTESPQGSAPPGENQLTQRESIDGLVRPVRRVLAQVLRSPAEVDDVLQESLLAILDATPSFRGESTLLHFALRISEHRALSTHRSAHRHAVHRALVARLEEPLLAGSETPEEDATRIRRTSVLQELLGSLPAAQRQALELRALLDCSLAEIADATGVSINTVRTRLRLARRTLLRRIEGDPALLDLLRG
jgi:RNA polymerase sigma-70 factor (ECF subfamily)